MNAVLNALATIALVTGFREIRERQHSAPPRRDGLAFFFSSIFLVSYLVNFTLHGETHFRPPQPLVALQYLRLRALCTHIPLAIIALPMILITFFFSLTGGFLAQKRLARWTFPIWLYVSVTGVIVYLMQAACR